MSRHLTPGQASRRAFLQRGSLLSLVGAAAPWALNLASMAEAAAQSSGAQGYKALVCVFLQGGNDHANTVLPYDPAEHQAYAQARGSTQSPMPTAITESIQPQPVHRINKAPTITPTEPSMSPQTSR